MTTTAAPLVTAGLSPDAALPARDALVDPAVVAGHLPRLGLVWGPVSGARIVRAKYRLGESLRVVWRVRAGGEESTLTVRAFAGDGAHAALPSAGDATADPAHGALWWRFPADRRLRQVERLLTPPPAFARDLGLRSWVTGSVAEYAPERSLTVRAQRSDGTAVAYVKAYAPGTVDVERLARRYRLLADAFADLPGLATPRVLATDDDLLVLEAMPGTTWVAASDDAVFTRLGQAIAQVHETPSACAEAVAAPFGRLRAERIATSASLVAQARPDVADAVLAVAARLTERPPSAEVVLLHGDCHPKNALINGAEVSLIDLDQAGLGDPAADLASLLGRLLHGVVVGTHPRGEARRFGAAFLDGYRAVRELPDEHVLRWHLAATVVTERAIRGVNRLHPMTLAHLPATIELADSLLDRGLDALEGP